MSEEARQRGHEVWGTYYSTPLFEEGLHPLRADLTKPPTLVEAFDEAKPDWVVLCGALTGVDYCEEAPNKAVPVNGEGPGAVARLCLDRRVRLVHISTDYVFDGRAGPYDEAADPNPLSHYGASKREGEVRVLETLSDALILRLSALYGWNRLRGKPNSVTWILARLRSAERVPLFADQRVSPTYAHEAASAILDLAPRSISGFLHLAAPECVTRLELGKAVTDVFDLPRYLLEPTTMARVPLIAPRPVNSCLISSRNVRLNTPPRPLREALAHMREAE